MSDRTFTKRLRHDLTQNGSGHRPTNNWGEGTLPAPWAEGDIVRVDAGAKALERMNGMGPGVYVISYATSIHEGDAWYFRVTDGGRGSDRLHVWTDAWVEEPEDWMAGVTLVETDDPDGLAKRVRMLNEGWHVVTTDEVCRWCDGTGVRTEWREAGGGGDE